MFEGKVKYEYDTRIDEFNWIIYFIVNFSFYILLFEFLKKYCTLPRPLKEYEEKKILPEKYLYYFNYLSLTHAFIGILIGKTPVNYL